MVKSCAQSKLFQPALHNYVLYNSLKNDSTRWKLRLRLRQMSFSKSSVSFRAVPWGLYKVHRIIIISSLGIWEEPVPVLCVGALHRSSWLSSYHSCVFALFLLILPFCFLLFCMLAIMLNLGWVEEPVVLFPAEEVALGKLLAASHLHETIVQIYGRWYLRSSQVNWLKRKIRRRKDGLW